jgi:hypothetical protein
MSEFKMFSPASLSKFKEFSQSLRGTVADPRRHQGAHDAKLRRRAHDEEMPAHVAKEMQREGLGPDPHSTRRLSRIVRELFGELAHNRFEETVSSRWPESLKDNSEREDDLHEQRLEDDTDEDDEDAEAEDQTEAEAETERRLENRKSDTRFVTEDDDDPNSQTLKTTAGTPTVGGRLVPNNKGGTLPRRSSGASDQARFNQRFGNAARIDSDPPRNPRKVAQDRKARKQQFLALDANSSRDYAKKWPGAARIKVI